MTSSESSAGSSVTTRAVRTFSEDVAFLQQHVETIVLSSESGRVAVVPAYQGRVMTSTTGGAADLSFGWLNYDTIAEGVLSERQAKGRLQAHIHVFGGEERFWLGPEGGQFGIYFPPGAPFEFEDWKTPAPIDTEPYRVVDQSAEQLVVEHEFQLQNHSGTRFEVGVRRSVNVLSRYHVGLLLGHDLDPDLEFVAYETENEIRNLGQNAWTRESGALSIWLLGMYKHSAQTTVAIPLKPGDIERLGPQVNDEYFGKVPSDRLKVIDDVVFFKADGNYRSKIGVTPGRSLGVAGSYAAETQTLNLVFYTQDQNHQGYVNSMWAHQDRPYDGDAINAYNDGSPEPGAAPLGPFYELETSSPAAFLEPGGELTHLQHTLHIRGDRARLDALARTHLRVGLDAIEAAF